MSGRRQPMKIEDVIFVDVSTDEAFRFVADPMNLPRWSSNVRSAALVTGEAQTQGSTYQVVASTHGLPIIKMVHKITRYEQPAVYSTARIAGPFHLEETFRFERCGSATRIAITTDVQPRGLLRPLAPLIRPEMRAGILRSHQELKAALEALRSSRTGY